MTGSRCLVHAIYNQNISTNVSGLTLSVCKEIALQVKEKIKGNKKNSRKKIKRINKLNDLKVLAQQEKTDCSRTLSPQPFSAQVTGLNFSENVSLKERLAKLK